METNPNNEPFPSGFMNYIMDNGRIVYEGEELKEEEIQHLLSI